jgi:hypothetical protein
MQLFPITFLGDLREMMAPVVASSTAAGRGLSAAGSIRDPAGRTTLRSA